MEKKKGYWLGKKRPEVKNFKGFIATGRTPWNKGKHWNEDVIKKLVESHIGNYPSKETKEKMSKAHLGSKNHYYGKHHSEEIRMKMKLTRSKQIVPIKDTTIEVKLQNYLKQLGIEFYTHQYIKEIEHSYQCDIIIPIQKGINKKIIIEAYGEYWHDYPIGREIDIKRCNELRKSGYRKSVV